MSEAVLCAYIKLPHNKYAAFCGVKQSKVRTPVLLAESFLFSSMDVPSDEILQPIWARDFRLKQLFCSVAVPRNTSCACLWYLRRVESIWLVQKMQFLPVQPVWWGYWSQAGVIIPWNTLYNERLVGLPALANLKLGARNETGPPIVPWGTPTSTYHYSVIPNMQTFLTPLIFLQLLLPTTI